MGQAAAWVSTGATCAQKGQQVRGSGDDLRTYFYQLAQLPELIRRNAFGRRFDGEGYEQWGGQAGKSYYMALRVQAMGDLNAVDIAQAVHVQIFDDARKSDFDLLEYCQALPNSDLAVGVYIDDTLVALICSEQQAVQPTGPDRVLLDKVHAAYAEASPPRAEEKGFGLAGVVVAPPSVGSLNFTTWGTQVDSPSGVVGTPGTKRGYLMLLGFVVLTCEVLPFILVEKYIALLVHPFMHRRECMASWHRVYKRLHGHDRKGLVTWKNAADVLDELWAATLLLSVAHGNIRWWNYWDYRKLWVWTWKT